MSSLKNRIKEKGKNGDSIEAVLNPHWATVISCFNVPLSTKPQNTVFVNKFERE